MVSAGIPVDVQPQAFKSEGSLNSGFALVDGDEGDGGLVFGLLSSGKLRIRFPVLTAFLNSGEVRSQNLWKVHF